MVGDQQFPDTLITYYLEMTSPTEFVPGYVERGDVEIIRMSRPDVEFYRFLYTQVGGVWRWRDRLLISEDELRQAISQPEISIFVLYVGGVPAGYVELAKQGESTEIAYFGLRPAFMGMGLGKHLLSFGIEQAWKQGTKRVYVHTCNLDAPQALENYQKRGMRVYKTEEQPMPQRYTV